MLIGIAGKAGSGKDEVATYLKNAHNFKQLAFATPVKDAIEAMFDIDLITLEQAGQKECSLEGLENTSLRKLYQTLGTDWGRNMIGKDIWITQARRQLAKLAGFDVVFSDVRFENEAEFIRQQGGTIIHVDRNTAKAVRDHSSEDGALMHPSDDMVILNDSTLPVLYDKTRATLELIRYEHSTSSAA